MFKKSDSVIPFLAGLGVGVAAAMLFTPEAGSKNRGQIRSMANRAGDALKKQADGVSESAADVLTAAKRAWSNQQKKEGQAVSEAADAAKEAASQVADKSRDLAHSVGKNLETGGKRLQEV